MVIGFNRRQIMTVVPVQSPESRSWSELRSSSRRRCAIINPRTATMHDGVKSGTWWQDALLIDNNAGF
jgi:hypothetical protein